MEQFRGWPAANLARQANRKFSKYSFLGIDREGAVVALGHNIVRERQAQPGAFSGGLDGKEGFENILPHGLRNAGAVVVDFDFDGVGRQPLR